jgi:hypothetical protein
MRSVLSVIAEVQKAGMWQNNTISCKHIEITHIDVRHHRTGGTMSMLLLALPQWLAKPAAEHLSQQVLVQHQHSS